MLGKRRGPVNADACRIVYSDEQQGQIGRISLIRLKGTTMAHPADTSDATFDADVIQNDTPVLVDFWAPWCGPCRMVAPIVEELSSEYDGRVKFVKLNTDENPGIASKYGIRSIPTLLVFKGGEVAGQIVGFRPKSDLQKRIEAVL
jgi:thioredoxin 1